MKLGKYTLLTKIGEGGFGEVWRAVGPNGACAIKLLHEPSFVDALRVEAAKLRELLHTPGIVRLLDHSLHGPQPYIVLELADGSLDDLISGPMAPAVAANYMLEVCRAVAAMHRKGIVHRDIKPGNILIKSGAVRLADFGLGKGDGSLLLTVGGAGTPGYMAPERMPSAASDVFGLGATLYHMLTGRCPPRNSDSLTPPGPAELSRLVRAMTNPSASARPTLSNVVLRLESLLGSTSFVDGSRSQNDEASGSLGGGLAALGIAALAGLAFFSLGNRYDRTAQRYRASDGTFRSSRFS